MNILYLLVTVFLLGDSYQCAKSVSSKKSVVQNKNVKITRIIGGSVATDPIPYQVSLQKYSSISKKWQHNCGGSIIGKNHILTAAHCTDAQPAGQLSVVVGTSNLKFGGLRHYVKSYVQHELYTARGNSVHNDVAVVKVSVPFKFNTKVAPISLAGKFSRRMENSYPVTLTGWGVTDMFTQRYLPDTLMILNYTTIPNEECQLRGFNDVTTNEVCALYGSKRGSCLGDSGGPLVNRERNTLIGIVSYGSNYCAFDKPDVYVRVSNFIPWIQRAVTAIIP